MPGKRYGGKKELYVLSSKRTFSAAEEFTYNLKNLKRATTVGETTEVGAHPRGPRRIDEHFAIWVPSGRAINPSARQIGKARVLLRTSMFLRSRH